MFNRRNIFLSYAREYKSLAREIAAALRSRNHEVFVDETSLRPGRSFDEEIYRSINEADILVFLISPQSCSHDSYALSELRLALKKWPNPQGRILPVMVSPTPIEQVPVDLRRIHILTPRGNIAFEVGNAVADMAGSASSGLSLPSFAGLPSIGSMPSFFAKRRVFISHSSTHRRYAAELSSVLKAEGYDVVWEGADQAGPGTYESAVHTAINVADTFIFLLAPNSVDSSSRASGELALAERRWPDPKGHVLPIAIERMPLSSVPRYLRTAGVVSPKGTLGLAVLAELKAMAQPQRKLPLQYLMPVAAFLMSLAVAPDVVHRYETVHSVTASIFYTGLMFGLVLAAGMSLTGRFQVRQAVVAAFVCAIAGGLAATIFNLRYDARIPLSLWQISFISGLVFGFFLQIAIAIAIPSLRRGPQWLILPILSGVVCLLTLPEGLATMLPFPTAAWAVGLSALAAWVGLTLSDRNSASGKAP